MVILAAFLRLIDGVNITMSDEHMWMVPYTEAGSHTLSITFSRPQELVGLRFWNYNKSTEDTYRGVSTPSLIYSDLSTEP